MPYFSKRSRNNLATCHPDLQHVFNKVIKHFDCSIICGHRTHVQQDALQSMDPPRTKVAWPSSKHNPMPSLAVDAVPYPIDWRQHGRMTYFAGMVLGVAISMGIELRWGGDWDRDTELDDQTFNDLPHFELVQHNQEEQ